MPGNWEKAEDVGIFDIIKSKNSLVESARKNFFKYNARRIGVNSLFFTSLLPLPFAPEADHAVKLGTAANGLYLMSDVLKRKETFFEALQTFVATKINHADRVGEMITANDLMNLYDRHGRDLNKAYSLPKMDTPEWQNDLKLFGRMADLMNQTYGNKPNTEKADFTVPKLIYLLGNGLVKSESLEKNLAYVELANRSSNMKKVSEMAEAFKGSSDLHQVMDQFAITLPAADKEKLEEERREQWKKWLTPEALKTLEENDIHKAQDGKLFADRVAAENRSTGRDVTPPSGNHADKAMQKTETAMGVS